MNLCASRLKRGNVLNLLKYRLINYVCKRGHKNYNHEKQKEIQKYSICLWDPPDSNPSMQAHKSHECQRDTVNLE